MKRQIETLSKKKYDILIIGCGVYGASVAREATLKGFSVAVIDKRDFCGATSANSLKIIHGGLRYLQQFNFVRLRRSVVERRNMMRIAPHIIHPLPCAMPTKGHLVKGKELMFLGLLINNIISSDRNTLSDPEKFIPNGRIISKNDSKKIIPGLNYKNITGSAIWYDAYAYNTERLVLGMLKSAVCAGADAANYVKTTGFRIKDKSITGVFAKDVLTGKEFEITAKLVINNTGPWLNETLKLIKTPVRMPLPGLALGINLVLKKRLITEYAVGLSCAGDTDKNGRLLFFMPWRDYTMVGTYYRTYYEHPDKLDIKKEDIDNFIRDINMAYPPADLTREDISIIHAGLLPAKENKKKNNPELLRNYNIINHELSDGIKGLLSVLSVKYTTARDVADKTIEIATQILGKKASDFRSAEEPIHGGNINNFQQFIKEAISTCEIVDESTVAHLVYNYGTEYDEILNMGRLNKNLLMPVGDVQTAIGAEIVYAVKKEMAQTLSDVIFRRTDIGSAGISDDKTIDNCALIMAKECGWNDSRRYAEIKAVKSVKFPGNDFVSRDHLSS